MIVFDMIVLQCTVMYDMVQGYGNDSGAGKSSGSCRFAQV